MKRLTAIFLLVITAATSTMARGVSPFEYSEIVSDKNTGINYHIVSSVVVSTDNFLISRSNKDGYFLSYRPIKGISNPTKYYIANNKIHIMDGDKERVFDAYSRRELFIFKSEKKPLWTSIR